MRSAPTPPRSIAVMLRSHSSSHNNSNSRCRSEIRCRTCRNSLVNSPKVRFVFPPGRIACSFVRDSPRCLHSTVLTVMLLPSCSWQTHVQLPRVESESQSSRLRPAEVRRIFALNACYPLFSSPSHLCGPRAREGRWRRGNITLTYSLVHSYANFLQEHPKHIIIIWHKH
jgi:hypothetical protein